MQIREKSIFYFWILGYLMFQTLNHTEIFPIQRKHFKDSNSEGKNAYGKEENLIFMKKNSRENMDISLTQLAR